MRLWCLHILSTLLSECRASWQPACPNWEGDSIFFSPGDDDAHNFAVVVSLKQIPHQLLGSCWSPIPLNRFESLVACHDSKLVSLVIQKSLIRMESRLNLSGGRFLSCLL